MPGICDIWWNAYQILTQILNTIQNLLSKHVVRINEVLKNLNFRLDEWEIVFENTLNITVTPTHRIIWNITKFDLLVCSTEAIIRLRNITVQ